MKHATNDFMRSARTLSHTLTKPNSRTNIFNHLHNPFCSPHDSLDFIHLLISSNPLATPDVNNLPQFDERKQLCVELYLFDPQ